MNYYPETLQQLRDYRDHDSLSQSFLKQVISNNTKPFKETIPMLIGSYLDALLTTVSLANDMFQVGLAKRPSEAIKGFIDRLWSEQEEVISTNLDVEGYKNRILEFVREAKYQSNWTDDPIWKSILKDGQDYWQELCSSQGKIIITKDEHTLCTTIAALTLSSSITAKYFLDQKNVDKHYQKDLYWISEGELCKGLLDLLIIEHETKTIYLTDIKSTGIFSLEEWFRMALQKGYIFQMSFYLEGVIQNYQHLLDEGYTIQCRWIVIPMNVERFKPWVIPCTEAMLWFGEHGYTKTANRYKNEEQNYVMIGRKDYKGWRYAIQQYKRCKSEGLVDYDLQWFDYGGKLPEQRSNELFFN